MNPMVRNILAGIAGMVIGSLVNMAVVNVGPSVIPLPDGADTSTMDSLRESMKLFKPVNFLVPFLAHALGALVAAFVAARFAASPMKVAMVVGVLSLAGGITAVAMLGGPVWFIVTDLALAYIPMSFLGAKLSGRA